MDDPCRYEYGTGTADDPYQIHGAPQLAVIGQHPADYDKHFLLATDIDMTAMGADDILPIGIPGMPFSGTFDGNGHTIKGFRLAAPDLDLVGLFGAVGHSGPDPNDPCGTVIDVKLADVDICGRDFVGGLAGANSGTIERCATDGRVAGRDGVGGLVGVNGWDRHATVRNCHSSASVTASAGCAGGFAGANSTLSVIEQCYSCGPVSAEEHLSGFIGVAGPLPVSGCFWDVDTAGAGETLADPNSGTGLPTSEMWRASPYLEAGWDFVGEVENGTKDIWWILEGQDYPRLWWELGNEASPS